MLLSATILLILSLLAATTPIQGANNVVKTASGEIQGVATKTLLNQRAFYSFRGIPYAAPPTGERRFKAPVKVSPWSGTKDASKYGPKCVQPDSAYNSTTIIGQEDCLYLNVFTPELTPKEKLPVIFYIHGGAFIIGAGSIAGPEILLDEDVVLVTVNYRLGPFGFLSLNTTEYSGNMGLKDQLLALQWVNENIHNFGGDKAKITLYGHSAGAVAVNLHVLSPASQNLFRRAIIEGASALNPWSTNSCNHTKIAASIVAKEKSKQEKDVSLNDVISTLKTIDAKQLASKTFEPLRVFGQKTKELHTVWAPVVESAANPNAFLNDSLENYWTKSKNIDTLFGYTSGEGLFFIGGEINNTANLKSFDETFEVQLPLNNLTYTYASKEYKDIVKDIRKFYFNDKPVNKESLQQFVQIVSDVWFVYGIQKAAKVQASKSTGKTFLKKFSVELDLNYLRASVNASTAGLRGAAHVEDLFYTFYAQELIPPTLKNNYTAIKADSKERNIIQIHRKFLTNFVKFGNPTPNKEPVDLKPIEKGTLNYVEVTNNGLAIGISPDSKSVAFWDGFLTKYRDLLKVPKYIIQ